MIFAMSVLARVITDVAGERPMSNETLARLRNEC
jgi:hypothetical protein